MDTTRLQYLLELLRVTKKIITYGDHGSYVAEVSVLTDEETTAVKSKLLQLLDISTR